MWPVFANMALQGARLLLEQPNTNQVPYRSSTPAPFIPNEHSNTIATRSDPTNRTHITTSTCVNCSSNVSRPSKTPERDYSHTKGKNSKHCLVVVPDTGNFDIRIRRTEAQFANLSVQSLKGSQQKTRYEHPKNRQQNATLKIQNGQKNNHAGPNVGKHNYGGRSNDNNMHGISKARRGNLSHNPSTWMYLGRLKVGTTEADIKTFLAEIFPGRQFKVELLPLYKDAKLPCFKVLVDNAVLEEFQILDPWPRGVKITKYIHNFKS